VPLHTLYASPGLPVLQQQPVSAHHIAHVVKSRPQQIADPYHWFLLPASMAADLAGEVRRHKSRLSARGDVIERRARMTSMPCAR
jgi:hypothetical protein